MDEQPQRPPNVAPTVSAVGIKVLLGFAATALFIVAGVKFDDPNSGFRFLSFGMAALALALVLPRSWERQG